MELPKNILDKIQKIYSDNPQGLNIIEEQIDLDANHDKIKQIDGKISDAKTTLNGFLKELGLPEF